MKIKKNQFYLILTAIFLAILLMTTYYIYNIKSNIQAVGTWAQKISEIEFLDVEIDLLFTNKVGYLNYDPVIDLQNQIRTKLETLENSPDFKIFLKEKKYYEQFTATKKKLEQKVELMNFFISNNSVLNNSVRALNGFFDLLSDKRELDHDIYINYHSNLLKLFLGLNIPTKKVLNNLNQEIEKLNKKDKSNKAFYLKHLRIVLMHYEIAQDIIQENNKLNFKNDIIDLSANLKLYVKDIFNKLYQILSIFFGFLAIALIIIYNLIISISKSTSTLTQFRLAVQNSDNSILVTDKKRKITYINKTFENIFGYSKAEVLGKTPSILKSGVHDKQFYKILNDDIKEGKIWAGEFVNKRKDGRLVYTRTSISPILDTKQQITGFMSIALDISEEKKYIREIETRNLEIRRRYEVDSLTNKWSHSVLMDRIAQKDKGILVYISIDHFADIGFFYGVSISNRIIIALTQTISLFIETYQLNVKVYRIQSDEFCLWFEEERFDPNALEYLREYVNFHPCDIEGAPQDVTITAGISQKTDTSNLDRLMQAVLAHHEAQTREIFQVQYTADNIIEQQFHDRTAITRSIKYALSHGKVLVYCQGIYNANNKKIMYYEVLIRLIDENDQLRFPNEFLDIAKKTSLYAPLTRAVISLTFELIESYPQLSFSMNLSSLDMLNEETKKWFLEYLDDCLNPSNLCVEILESEGIDDYDAILPFIKKIKERGCKLAIDDFGSGYSNYYRILQLDIDLIKIDGSIIKSLPYDNNARSVVETIMDFANRQGYGVVAEFVSDAEVFKIVQEHGIELVQGYYLGKPVPVESISV